MKRGSRVRSPSRSICEWLDVSIGWQRLPAANWSDDRWSKLTIRADAGDSGPPQVPAEQRCCRVERGLARASG